MAAKKFVRMWQPWPSNERYQNHLAIVAIAGSFIPIISLSAFALALNLNRLRFLTPILIWIIGYTLVHMIFLGTIRYRFPLEPFLIILAGGTIRLLDSKPHFAARLGAHGPTK